MVWSLGQAALWRHCGGGMPVVRHHRATLGQCQGSGQATALRRRHA